MRALAGVVALLFSTAAMATNYSFPCPRGPGQGGGCKKDCCGGGDGPGPGGGGGGPGGGNGGPGGGSGDKGPNSGASGNYTQSSAQSGDPVDLGGPSFYERHKDLTFPFAFQPDSLWRTTADNTGMFSNFGGLLGWDTSQGGSGPGADFTPKPFGSISCGPAGNELCEAAVWLSSMSMVSNAAPELGYDAVTERVFLFDVNGYPSSWLSGSGPAGARFLKKGGHDKAYDGQLWFSGLEADGGLLGDGGTKFVLYRKGEGRYTYAGIFGTTWDSNAHKPPRRFFLTRYDSVQYDGGGYTVNYAVPDSSCPQGTSAGTTGVPYISTIVGDDGTTATFTWRTIATRPHASGLSLPNTECVLSSVEVVADAGVYYSYEIGTDGGEQGGWLRAATSHDEGSDNYTLTSSAYTRSRDGMSNAFSLGTSGEVTSVLGPVESFAVTQYSAGAAPYSTSTWDSGSAGDGTGNGAIFTNKVYLGEINDLWHGPHADRHDYSCSPSGACSNVSTYTNLAYNNTPPAGQSNYERSFENGRGYFHIWDQDAGSDAGDYFTLPMLMAQYWGSTSSSPSGALESERYGYGIGGQGQFPFFSEQLRTLRERDSVFSSGNLMQEKQWFDSSTNRLTKVTKSGYTTDLYQSVSQRIIGTFYFTSRSCQASAGPDPFGRTLEVHGPCVLSAETDTDCSGTYPVTVYDYFGSGNGTSSYRLHHVYRFKEGSYDCSGSTSPLTTTYTGYDGLGNITGMVDEGGATIAYTYAGTLLASRTVTDLSATTSFSYDNAKLAQVTYPLGNAEVTCYRTSSGAPAFPCAEGSGTVLTANPVYRAKTNGATDGSARWSELVKYSYRADGTMSQAEYWNCTTSGGCSSYSDGEKRRVERFDRDAIKRATYRGWGSASGQFDSKSFFDRANNLAGIGLPSNTSTPAFCGGPGSGAAVDTPTSNLCSTLAYDGADRLASLTQYPDGGSAGETTCFFHDGQGNVSAVQQGVTSSCPSSPSSSSAIQYHYDDFGVPVWVDVPFGSDGSTGPGRYVYVTNARGEVVYDRTPTLEAYDPNSYTVTAWRTYSRDELDRVVQLTIWLPTGAALVYRVDYDTVTYPSGCPGSLHYTGGRMAHRLDGWGDTFLDYDAEGRVVGEIRMRYYNTDCSSTYFPLYFDPHTFYSYNANGDLTTLTYPHGRQVTFNYGTGAYADRVSSIDIQKRVSGAWSNQTGVIHDVAWEPYGGLRGYQVAPPSGNAFTVEYALGDDGSGAPSTQCPATFPSSSSSDFTGRLRAVRVSSGTQSMGGGSADIYNRTYTWQGDVPTRIDSCTGAASDPRTVLYGYDTIARLITVDGGYPIGPVGQQGFSFDWRGNRLGWADVRPGSGGGTVSTSYSISSSPTDQLASTSRSEYGSSTSTRTYSWDRDGRISQVSFGPSDAGDSFNFAYYYGSGTTFVGTQIGGAWYSWGADMFNRRVGKSYPTGYGDNYFWDLGHQMLADTGLNSVTNPSGYPVDDYVWLGGRPVVLIHGWLDLNHDRANDTLTSCPRNDDPSPPACGFYFPVTDHLGTPVLMLDSQARVTATVDHDPSGYPNRGHLVAQSAHPYANSTNSTLGSFQVTTSNDGGFITEARAKFSVFETAGTGDGVELQVGGSAVASLYPASMPLSPIWTPWATVSSSSNPNTVNLVFKSDSSGTANGVVAEDFEYRRHQAGANYFFTPLRYPGQYHDEETDFFENANRYYEAASGRYLSTDPKKLLNASAATAGAQQGFGFLTYTYANGNPISHSDPDGLGDRQSCPSPNQSKVKIPEDSYSCNGSVVNVCEEADFDKLSSCEKNRRCMKRASESPFGCKGAAEAKCGKYGAECRQPNSSLDRPPSCQNG